MLTVRMFMCAMAMLLTSAGARGEECQPLDLDATSRVRRDAAVTYLVAVNRAQMQRQKQGGKYAPLNELTDVPGAPVGFVPKLLIDRWSYIVSLKDYLDVCGVALFSDERGVIYEAHSVRPSGAEADAATDENP
jgi:hypothetical protein